MSLNRSRTSLRVARLLACSAAILLLGGCAGDRQWGDTRPGDSGPDLEGAFWGAANLAAHFFAGHE